MKIVFWNINKGFKPTKSNILRDFINYHKPDIMVIAEGVQIYSDRQTINSMNTFFQTLGYNFYYHPLLTTKKGTPLSYSYNGFGLKIYFRPNSQTNTIRPIKLDLVKQNGRLIFIPFYLNGKNIILALIHNYSSNNTTEREMDQRNFLKEIRDFDEKVAPKYFQNSQMIIIGDFNLSPWDKTFSVQSLLETYIVKNIHGQNIILHPNPPNYIYYCPLYELFASSVSTIGGTYIYNNRWTIIDYILVSNPSMMNYLSIKIIDKMDANRPILDFHISKASRGKVTPFDHLPIELNI